MNAGRQIFLESGLFVFILLAPLSLGAVYPWGSMSLAGILFFLFLFLPDPISLTLRLPKFFSVSLAVIFFGLLGQILFSSTSRYLTGIELLKWFACACGFITLQSLEKASVYRLLGLFIFLGGAESLYGIFEVASGREHVLWQAKESYRGLVTGTYINKNHLAGFLEMALGIHAGFLLLSLMKQKFGRFVFLSIFFLFIFAGLLKTGSRMGSASMVIIFLIFSGMLLFRFRGLNAFSILIAGTGLLAAAFFFLSRDTLLLRFRDLEVQEALFDRLLVWQDALRIIRDHPAWGIGLGTYEWIFPSYQSEKIFFGWKHAHNDYLELAAELGIPLFLVLVFSFSALWFYGMKRLFSSSHRPAFPLAWGGLMGASALVLHGFLDFNFAIPANHYLFVLLLGMIVRLLQFQDEVAPWDVPV